MARFKEVNRFDHPELESELIAWWEKERIFERSVTDRSDAPTYTFYEGPPTANGRPGIHHVMARAIKDIFCRFQTMKGHKVERKAGWDTHGLPVEIEVEKELGLESREDVLDYGIAKYNEACRESVLRYKELWDRLTTRMGYWVDLNDPYMTFDASYIESVWALLKKLHEKDLLYEGYKIQWYSPGSGTVLSSHEVSLGYEEVQDPSVYVRFPLKGEENTYFLAWTTTPWTLISNTALAVDKDLEYVKVRHNDPHQGNEYLIIAAGCLGVIDEDYTIEERFKGADLLGLKYDPVFPYFEQDVEEGDCWYVVSADFVSTEDGTGVVHMAPAFGADDYKIGQEEGLPLFNPIAPDGTFTEKIALVDGVWFKDADRPIATDLRDRGLMYKHETYLHNYPHDWRKGTPLMSYPVKSWFVRTTAFKDRMVELNDTINWQPEGIGTGRFGEWLENNVDWALSRRRYWGTPLPIWVSDVDPDYIEVIGSIEELRANCDEQLPEDNDEIDLHRPFVDDLTWPAPDDVGGTMKRIPDLIDVWFDSGAMPYAQWHYPFENDEEFQRNFPADFIAEGVDQTRGWFYTLHAISTLTEDSVAYKNVVVNGLVLDEEGNKMSKSKGNAVEPFEVIGEYGADAVRWYMMSNTAPWENIKFSERSLRDNQRKFFGTLGNVYGFFATYANIDEFLYTDERLPVAERTELDRWIMSRLNSTISVVEDSFSQYDPTTAARAVESFVEELSNWHIRRSRSRFWASKKGEVEGDESKVSIYQTVYECLDSVARMMSPIAPFFGEWLYRALQDGQPEVRGPESVHLARFPQVEDEAIDRALERRMSVARTISSLVLALRNQVEIHVRQPLPRILVVTGTTLDVQTVEAVRDLILDEVNVKKIEYVSGSSDVVQRSAKPNFPRLGSRLGSMMKPVNEAVRNLSNDEIDTYLQEGIITLDIDGESVELGPDDLIISSQGIAGWEVDQRDGITVALDTEITEALLTEGLAREAVKRIQNLRKEANFDVTDRIKVQFRGSAKLTDAMHQHAGWIRNETLAMEFEQAPQPEGEVVETFQVGQEEVELGVRRAATS